MSRNISYPTIVVLLVAFSMAVNVGPAFAQFRTFPNGIDPHAGLSTDHADQSAQLNAIQEGVEALLSRVGRAFPGDGVDGPPLSYQDNDDGTVTDLNTGLMYEMKVAGGGGCTTDLHAVNATCTWADATGDWIDAINAEGGTGYAGYDDWRLTNVRELMSIVDYSTFNPAIGPIFGPTAAANYWSSTSNALNPGGAWIVDFSFGNVSNANKFLALRVRAVRGGR